jgi:MYXO-CTERM domain-containing protein
MWEIAAQWVGPFALLVLLAIGAWRSYWMRRRTIVCPMCDGAGRLLKPPAEPSETGGEQDDG